MCVFSFLDGDARWTQGFILVRAKEDPTSSGGREFVLSCTKCLYRGEYKKDSMRVLSLSAEKRCMQVVFFVSYVVRCLSSLASASPFIVQGEAQGYRV